MKAEIEIPAGFKKVKVGYLAVKGDYCLSVSYDFLTPILEWQNWKVVHEVKRGEIFIRKRID